MKQIFRPEDFSKDLVGLGDLGHKRCAEIANKKINELIQSWPVVRNTSINGEVFNQGWSAAKTYGDTHQALLAFIEEIQDPCIHPFSNIITFPNNPHKAKCGICSKYLVATWSEVK